MTNRILSVDIFRAVTMLLMIFVNDLGSLRGIPLWLEHVENGVDGIAIILEIASRKDFLP